MKMLVLSLLLLFIAGCSTQTGQYPKPIYSEEETNAPVR